MKNISEYLNASSVNESGFDPRNKNHKEAWNELVAWFDKQLNHMNSYDLAEILHEAAARIEQDEFDKIR